MASGTGRVTAVLALLASIAKAIDVNVTGEWKPDLGWEVICSWETLPNDTLQSVRLYNNDQQFMIYRPELNLTHIPVSDCAEIVHTGPLPMTMHAKYMINDPAARIGWSQQDKGTPRQLTTHGHGRSQVFEAPDMEMRVNCAITTYRGQEGSCSLLLEPYKAPVNTYTYSCEVSGERPLFRIGKKDYVFRIFVPPLEAKITSNELVNSSPNRVTLNCSSAGLPAPHLHWTVAKDKHQADFSDRYWNSSSKLWHVWSQLSYTRNDNVQVICSPEVTSNIGIVKGKQAEYNSATTFSGPLKITLTVLLLNLFR